MIRGGDLVKRCIALFVGVVIMFTSCFALADTLDLSVLKNNSLIELPV